jgi:hypothetical protein
MATQHCGEAPVADRELRPALPKQHQRITGIVLQVMGGETSGG